MRATALDQIRCTLLRHKLNRLRRDESSEPPVIVTNDITHDQHFQHERDMSLAEVHTAPSSCSHMEFPLFSEATAPSSSFTQSNSSPLNDAMNSPPAHDCDASDAITSTSDFEPPQQFLNSRPSMYAPAPNPLQEAQHHLHTLFTVYEAKTRLQDAVLKFIREVPVEVLKSMPLNHATIREGRMYYERYDVPRGTVIYFGIVNVLTFPGVDLYDRSANEVLLSVNIDGLPLFRDPNGVGFWPILGAAGEYPVFLIGFYCGKGKPYCANAYLRPFVKEVKRLEREGLNVMLENTAILSTASLSNANCGTKVYRFRLHNMILDAPALSFTTCIVGHAAAYACPKCTESGLSVLLEYMGLTKEGKPKKGIRYEGVGDAAARSHQDFRVYLKYCVRNGLNAGKAATDCCPDYSAVREHYNEGGEENDDIFDDMFGKNDDEERLDGFDSDDQLVENKSYIALLKHHHYQKSRAKKKLPNPNHVTILSTLKHFDIVKDIPFDYMHLVLGIMETAEKMEGH